jgi:hypothetical protein
MLIVNSNVLSSLRVGKPYVCATVLNPTSVNMIDTIYIRHHIAIFELSAYSLRSTVYSNVQRSEASYVTTILPGYFNGYGEMISQKRTVTYHSTILPQFSALSS